MPNVLPASLPRTLATPRAALVSLSLLCSAASFNAWAADPLLLDTTGDAASRASTAASVFKTRDAAALKGIHKVAINSFQIDFVTRSSATAQTVGFANTGRANASLYYNLTGLAPADFQAITDQLFAQFTASLAQQGYEVLSREQMNANASYRKMSGEAAASPMSRSTRGGEAMVYSPTGVPLLRMMGEGTKDASMFGLVGAMVGAGSMGMMDMAMLPTELNATVLDVRFALNYVDMASNTGSFLGRLSGSAVASAKLQPTLSAESTVLHVRSATAGTTIELQTALVLQGNAIREVKDTTSTADTVGVAAVNVLAALAGINSSSSSKTMSAMADPAEYRSVVGSNLATASDMMVSRLVAGR